MPDQFAFPLGTREILASREGDFARARWLRGQFSGKIPRRRWVKSPDGQAAELSFSRQPNFFRRLSRAGFHSRTRRGPTTASASEPTKGARIAGAGRDAALEVRALSRSTHAGCSVFRSVRAGSDSVLHVRAQPLSLARAASSCVAAL